jgi:hypothetical protein
MFFFFFCTVGPTRQECSSTSKPGYWKLPLSVSLVVMACDYTLDVLMSMKKCFFFVLLSVDGDS